jgi:hypothetical protein
MATMDGLLEIFSTTPPADHGSCSPLLNMMPATPPPPPAPARARVHTAQSAVYEYE